MNGLRSRPWPDQGLPGPSLFFPINAGCPRSLNE